MLGPVTCQACGAKVRADRPCCLRCGEPLRSVPREPTSPEPRRVPSAWIGAIAGVVLLGGFAAVGVGRATGSAASASTAAHEHTASATPAAAPDSPSRDEFSPAPISVSMDVSRVGVAAYNEGDVSRAIEQFSAAVAADPGNADALNNLGQVLVRSGRAAEAIGYFDNAISVSGSVWAYHFIRARAYAELQEWNRAAAGYRDAARLFPDDYVTAFNLARSLQAGGNLPDAILEYRRAISLAPGEPDFLLSLASALEAAQQPGEAAATYAQYLTLQESSPQADKIRARIAQLQAAGAPAAGPQTP